MSVIKKVWSSLTGLLSSENLALLNQRDRFVILTAGLLILAALGVVAAPQSTPTGTKVLVGFAMFLVFCLVVIVQYRSVTMKNEESDLMLQAEAAKAVNGEWWQLVFADDHPGLTYVSICISEIAERHAMNGITYNADGRRLARWSSDAVAIKSSSPLELYYVWRGTILEKGDTSIVSGIGRLRFDSVGREKLPQEGEGVFTRGSKTEMHFGTPRTVELIRFTKTEREEHAEKHEVLGELASKAFQRFKLEKGRAFHQEISGMVDTEEGSRGDRQG